MNRVLSLVRATAAVVSIGLASGQAMAADARGAQLIVGDAAAKHLYVYRLPDLHRLADFDDISVGVHAGTITLADGRVLIPDEIAKQLVVLKVSGSAPPAIVKRVPMPIPLADRYAWTAIDPAGRYFLATSDDDDEAVELLTVVDLQTYQARQFRVDVGDAEAEFGITVVGDPAQVAFHLSERVALYPLAALARPDTHLNDIIEGKIKPTESFSVGKGGHSDTFSPVAGTWTGSTLRGLEVARIAHDRITESTTIPWDIDGRSGGRNARERMTPDGQFEFGPLNAVVPPEKWAETENDLHWLNLTSLSASRTPLGKGIVGRGGVSRRLAIYANVHPDGDFANLIDTDAASASFRQVVARIPLEKLSHAPVRDRSPADAESRYAAITPDGRMAFVTHGGDGIISVIDTTARKVTDKIVLPTPMRGGGYITIVTPDAPPFEFSGR